MATTTQRVDVSQLDERTTHIFDVYDRSRGIYERTLAAMGRLPRYRVTEATTASVKVGDVKHRTS